MPTLPSRPDARRARPRLVPAAIRTAAFLALCTLFAPAALAAPAPIRAVVSIPPLKGLIEPIITAAAPTADGKPAPVTMLIPPGRSEHGYEIPPSKLAELNAADLVVIVGLGIEPQVDKFVSQHARPDGKTRHLIRFADVLNIAHDESHEHHHHGPGEECNHHGPDPHLWLDPVMVERLVDAVTLATVKIVQADTEAVARVRKAGEETRARVRAIHEDYAVKCGGFSAKTIVVGHDAWGRLADRYGLTTVAIAGLTATEPTPGALDRAKKTVIDNKLRVIFTEPQLSDRAGRRIASVTGVQVRTLDPLGSGDWFGLMQTNLAELERALGDAPPAEPRPSTQPEPRRTR